MKKPVALICVLSLTSCQTTGESGLSKETLGTGLGAIVGAIGGSFLGKGKGRYLAVAAGLVGGGLLGKQIGQYLDEQDKKEMADSTEYALDNSQVGQGAQWVNPDTGNSGSISNFVSWAIVMKMKGASYGYRERSIGSVIGGARPCDSFR